MVIPVGAASSDGFFQWTVGPRAGPSRPKAASSVVERNGHKSKESVTYGNGWWAKTGTLQRPSPQTRHDEPAQRDSHGGSVL